MDKSLKLSTLLIVILVTIIGAILYFGYFYHLGSNPFADLTPGITEANRPKPVVAFNGGKDPLARPLAVAAGSGGRIYAADTGNNRIIVFNQAGKVIKAFGRQGANQGEFNFPSGVAVGKSGRVYVADFKNNRVQIFDQNGVYVGEINSDKAMGSDGKPLKFSPVTLTVDSNDNVYISDTFRHRVLVFDQSGAFIRSIGSEGSQPGQILYANGLAIDGKNKRLLVSDSNNARIQAFDLQGKFLWKQESAGKDSFLVVPKGIAVGNGVIYVSDTPAHRIVVYDLDGKPLYKFGLRSVELDGFNFPSGLNWDSQSGRLYIADRENQRIDVYK
jgi:tripartite motif-containing protein 71